MERAAASPDPLRVAAPLAAARAEPLAPWRLNVLRAGYGLLVMGLGSVVWPELVDPSTTWGLSRGIVVCMLCALSALSLLGLRHPLAMLPLLFFELAWKMLWLLRVALPAVLGNQLDATTIETMFECLLAVVFVLVIPWSYVVDRYARAPADPWRRPT